VGAVIESRVEKVVDFGIFIKILTGINGLVHVSDLNWSKDIGKPSDFHRKGQQVTAVILGIDKANRRISLGMKQLVADPWNNPGRRMQPGDSINVSITRRNEQGLIVEIRKGLFELIPEAKIPEWNSKTERERHRPGHNIEAQVEALSIKDRRIWLTLNDKGEKDS